MKKASIRIISHSKYNAHTETIFKLLSILSLENLLIFYLASPSRLSFFFGHFNSVWLSNSDKSLKDFHHMVLRKVISFWRDCRRRSNFCPDRGSNPRWWGTSAPEAKVLTTRPPVVPYSSGIGAGLSSTSLTFFLHDIHLP